MQAYVVVVVASFALFHLYSVAVTDSSNKVYLRRTKIYSMHILYRSLFRGSICNLPGYMLDVARNDVLLTLMNSANHRT